MRLDAALDEAIAAAAVAALPASATSLSHLLAGISSVSDRYVTERERLADPRPDTPAERAARALFFLPADLVKIHVPLAELAAAQAMPAGPLAILDLGCGLGTLSIGLLAHLGPRAAHASITLSDHDPAALALAHTLVGAAAAHLGIPVSITTRAIDLHGLPAAAPVPAPSPPPAFILLGTTLNELHLALPDPARTAARAALVSHLVATLAPDGALIIIEPALRETARALEQTRDVVLAAATPDAPVHVFAPCTHAAPCSALIDPRDFCHEDRPFNPPPRLARLISQSSLRSHGLKFAYLTLRRAPGRLSGGARVVSAPLSSKGKTEWFTCSATGRATLRILTRQRDDASRDLLRTLDRGDQLDPSPIPSAPIRRPRLPQ